jgi:RNA polymerase sigma factor for flagellar operon FliA
LEDLAVDSASEWEGTQQRYIQNIEFDPLTFVENKDLVDKLATAVAVLPERERLVVTLYYHEELTLREIGEILNLSEGRICQIFGQAVGRLRAALGVTVKARDGGKRAAKARDSSMKPVRV